MNVHRQRCQACGSIEVRNILVRAPGRAQTVLVRCASCLALVARYELASYYHHGKGFASWLPHLARPSESARELAEAFESVREDALDEYAEALSQLQDDSKKV